MPDAPSDVGVDDWNVYQPDIVVRQPSYLEGFDEIMEGLSAREARYEAQRCYSCGECYECDNCMAACPEEAIVKLGIGEGYDVRLDACTGCAACFEQCPCHAIEMIPETPEHG